MPLSQGARPLEQLTAIVPIKRESDPLRLVSVDKQLLWKTVGAVQES